VEDKLAGIRPSPPTEHEDEDLELGLSREHDATFVSMSEGLTS